MEIFNNSSYIVLVQTEEVFSQRASLDLKDLGYSPIIIPKLDLALSELKNLQPALMIINPLKNKSETAVFCRKLREQGSKLRILMILASDTVEDRSICLEAGADDYLTLPYRSDALVQLVHFYLQPTDTPIEQMQFGELLLDLSNRYLLLKDQKVELTMKEFELLKYLMANPRQVLTREQILENVWGYDFQGASNVIEVYIRYLRLKIEGEGQKRLIHTVRGVGYVLRDS